MIQKWISFQTLVDNLFDEITPSEMEGNEDGIKRIALRYVYSLLDRCNAPKNAADPITGVVKNGGIDLPEDCSEVKRLKVDNQPISFNSVSGFMRKADHDRIYKAKIVGNRIMFSIVGGVSNLDGKEYKLEYDSYPLVNGELYIPFEFENATIEHIRYVLLRQKIESQGRGQGLLKTAFDIRNDAATRAISDVEFPGFDEWIQIGRIWESKVPASIEKAHKNDFKGV